MKQSDIVLILEPVVKCFEELGILYYVGGSVASSSYGIARATLDIDLVSNLQSFHVEKFVERLKKNYFVDKEMILNAISTKSFFNIIHLKTMFKIDIFVLQDKPYPLKAFERMKKDTLDNEFDKLQIYLCSAEDIILMKLDWYNAGGKMSERQWLDVLGVMKVQNNLLDLDYLRKWALELNVLDLLEKALIDGKL